MQSNGSMNRVYRLVWNATTGVWQAVCECSKGRGKAKASKPRATSLSTLIAGAFVVLPLAALAADLPTGGVIVAGSANIVQSGSTMTVTQTTGKMAADWQSFNIGAGNTVNFVQPSASAVALNRVLGSDVSVIQGALNANGQVFLVNPNGVLFTPTALVNVGAIVASTLNLSTADFMAGNYTFDSGLRNADEGYSVINHGKITAHGENSNGGTIALIAAKIINTGTLAAQGGNVLLGAGSQVLLDLGGPVKLQVTQGALNTLIEQGGAIRADGGRVYLTTKAAGDLASSVINHTGITEARTLSTGQRGEIVLMGDMAQGTVNVGGTLDASAPNGGAGGFIETSAATVKIADAVHVSTAAAHGVTGSWLIDPTDFSIASGAGALTSSGIGATTLQNALASTDVTIATSAANTGSELGDIHVNSAVAWSANTLTLNAHNNININATLNGGVAGKLSLLYGQATANGGTSTYNVNAAVNLAAGPNFSTQLGSTGPLKNYTVITALGSEGSTTGADLQGMSGDLAGNYALGSDVAASASSSWNAGAGFNPIGADATPFTGTFAGLGHAISKLTIDRQSTEYIGLFGSMGVGAMVQNLGLIDSNIYGSGRVGPLAGFNDGTVSNSYATGTTYGGTNAGGLVGLNGTGGVIQNSYSTGSLYVGNRGGGLVGVNVGSVSDSYSTVSVINGEPDFFGGLVGQNTGSITRSYATGVFVNVYNENAGSLVGYNGGTVSSSYWNASINSGYSGIGGGVNSGATGLTSAQMQEASNFTGFNFTTTPGATGNNWVIVNGDGSLNGAGTQGGGTTPLLASEFSTTIQNAHQLQLMAMNMGGAYSMASDINAAATAGTGNVWGSAGFVPIGSYFTNNYFTGTFDGLSHTITGLTTNIASNGIGFFGVISGATIKNVGLVGGSVTGSSGVGGLVGMSNAGSSVSKSFNTGLVTGGSSVGGLVGLNGNGGSSTVSNSYSTGTITLANGFMSAAGGLVGDNNGTISNSYATGLVTGAGGMQYVGGLVGDNNGTISNGYWDTSVNATGIGRGTSTGAAGLTATEMKTTSKLVGFDFASPTTWGFSGSANSGYPVLCAFGGCIAQVITVYINPLTGSSVYGSTPVFSYSLVDGSGALYSLTNASVSGTAIYGSAPTSTSNAGSYTFSYDSGLALGGADAGNYSLAPWTTPTAWTVNKAQLTVTADNQTRLYGAANPSFTQTISGYVNSETSAVLSGSAFGSSAATAGTGVGTAAITGSTGTLAATNYDFTAANGTLTINPAALTVTANAASKTYDGAAYSGGNDVAYSGFVNSETFNVLGGTLGYSGTSQGAANAGSYAITPAGLTSSNYTVSFVDGALTIDKAHLTVTADNQSRVYGAANPSFTQTISGYVNSETSAVLSGSATGSSTAVATTGVGTTAITASTGTLAATNYDFTVANGTLTINPAALTVTANAASKTYDGAAYSGGNDVAYSGFVNSETFSVLSGTLGYAGTSQGAINTGSYTITPGGLTSSNYTVSFVNGALTIAPRAITVTADAKSKASGDIDPTLTYQVTTGNLVGGDSLSGALTRATGETAGAYAIGQGTVTDTSNPNYQIAYLGADLTINAAPTSNRTTDTDQSITQAAITIATQTASQTARSGDSGNGSVGFGTTTSTASFSPSRVESPTGANNNGGLALVEVADAPSAGQNTSTSNVGGFMTVFVVNGGINTGNNDILPTTAR